MIGQRYFQGFGNRRFRAKAFLRNLRQVFLLACSMLIPLFLLVGVGLVVYDIGFQPFWQNSKAINLWLQFILDFLSVLMAIRLVLVVFTYKKLWTRIFAIAGWLFILFLTLYILPHKASLTNFSTNHFLFIKVLLYAGIVLAFVTEASYLLQFIYNRAVNPAFLFVSSFALLILLGAFLLKLPNSTYQGITVLDALFTATSAVCVTGLIVVDTATHFTTFGQLMILLLIQIGGLGIMTFAGLLSYAVAGSASFKSQLAFRDMMSSREMNNIMNFIYRVVAVTLLFELIGAIGIYFLLGNGLFETKFDRIFFSVFHSVSAFCNAGFSTYTNGLYEEVIRFNYSLQLLIAFLIILGGIGFPIVFNLFRYLKLKMNNTLCSLRGDPRREHFPNLIQLNSRLALFVTFVLLTIGFVTYLIFEQSATLQQHPAWSGKIVTAFFGSVTPRTAGFNTVDLTALSLPTIMIYLLLMWIGASPGSTGGGIHTTTAGVAVLNMAAVVRGKDRAEIFRSEISHHSVRRAFAIILLSLLAIGMAVFFISINDQNKGLIRIAFEAFSAFSTVGLSLNLTPLLSVPSKIVLIITMFIGRVGMITLLVAFIRQSKPLYYRLPKEDVAF